MAEAPVDHPSRRRRSATVLVCRGCCCGTERKHPEVDHEAQLARLRAAAEGANVHVRAVGCLGPCGESNVIVVRPPGADQRRWLGRMLDEAATEALARWILGGCRSALPAALEPHLLGATAPEVAG